MGAFTIAQIDGDPDLTISANLVNMDVTSVTIAVGANGVSVLGGLSVRDGVSISGSAALGGNLTAHGQVITGLSGLSIVTDSGEVAFDLSANAQGVVAVSASQGVRLQTKLMVLPSQLVIEPESSTSGGDGNTSTVDGGPQLSASVTISEYMRQVVLASLKDPTFLLGLRAIITAQVADMQAATTNNDTLDPGPVVS
jgi:hypothetical protein